MNTIEKRIQAYLSKIPKQKVELSDLQEFLKYYIGVETFGKNIDIDEKEISKHLEKTETLKRSLRVDLEDMQEDMERVAVGIKRAETAAKSLGVNPKEIPNYNKAVNAMKYGTKQVAKGKQLLKSI
tara:strand:- start:3143 stop:3520 length:378 start_codon:yes stop_codon:yes gene_type:complete